jgi:hypothetical protein
MRILLLSAIALYGVDLISSVKVNVFRTSRYSERPLENPEMGFTQVSSSTGISFQGTNQQLNPHPHGVYFNPNVQNDNCNEKSFSKNKCIAENGCVWTGEECKRLGVF